MTFPFPQVGPDFLETQSVCVCVCVCVVHVRVFVGRAQSVSSFIHNSSFPCFQLLFVILPLSSLLREEQVNGYERTGAWWGQLNPALGAYCEPEAQLVALCSVGSCVGFSSVLDFLWSSVYRVYLFRSLFPIGSPHGQNSFFNF